MSGISRDDWLKAIADVMPPPPVDDAVTITEFAEMAKCAPNTARNTLLAMAKAGKAKEVQKRIIRRDGRSICVLAYQLVKAKKK